MSLASSLKTYLLADSTVSSLVGTRIRFQQAHPTDRQTSASVDQPYIEFFIDEDREAQDSDGGVGVFFSEVSFDIYATTESSLSAIKAALKTRMEAAKRTSLTDVDVVSSRYAMSVSGPRNAPQAGQNFLRFSTSVHFDVTYKESS